MFFNRVITLTVPSSDVVNYSEIYQVAPQYVNQALTLAKYFQGAIDGSTLRFDFEKALQIANDIPQAAVVNTLNQTVQQGTVQVSVMIDKIVDIMKNVLSIVIDNKKFWDQVTAAITNTFTNLNSQESERWIFYYKEDAHKTSYYYNILFAIQDEETGGVMATLPIAFDISVDIEKEKVLFVTIKDTENYAVTVKAINVVQALQSSRDSKVVDAFKSPRHLPRKRHKICSNS
uniref:Insecticidal crystal protein CryET29 n=1 Tax=Bacillus thuringiensis TaxID=1428 RepID=Q93M48_BACTU|nr:insecticidal crystal protein CryET29 [Bacillus thuringiensis]AMD39460.1 Cyt2C1 [synthetic construct]